MSVNHERSDCLDWRPLGLVLDPGMSTKLQVWSVLAGFGTALAWELLFKAWTVFDDATADRVFSLPYIGAVLALAAVHECIHALAVPGVFRGGKVRFGASLQRGLVYCEILTPLQRNSYVLMLLAPALALTLAPMVLALVLPGYRLDLALLASINAGLSVADTALAWTIWRGARPSQWVGYRDGQHVVGTLAD